MRAEPSEPDAAGPKGARCALLYPDLRNLRVISVFVLGKLSPAHPHGPLGENEPMAESAPPPALPEAEQRAAETLLTRALGEPGAVQAAESLWDRGHVFRLRLASGRTVILKRKRRQWPIGGQLFGDELAALDYLNGMPVPVAPRLLGADAQAGLLLMEDLGDGATLADSLMAAGRERVQAELVA